MAAPEPSNSNARHSEPDDVDIAIAALADPTRRRVVELLVASPQRTNELADAIGVSVPAVSRHLRVLREKGVVQRVDVEGDGRGREYRLDPERLESLSVWLGGERWSKALPDLATSPDAGAMLARVGGFLDAFAESDAAFFQRHLSDDVELYFPQSSQRWDKATTVESVAGHAPYVEWAIADSSIRALAPGLTLVTITVAVRTTDNERAKPVVQSMVFDDTASPWTLRFLQQTPADQSPNTPEEQS